MKVTAAVARSRGNPLHLETLELSEPEADEILVRTVACGVAEADLDGIGGRLSTPLPFVPGTEGAGIVERVGREVSALAPGDAVILGFDFCGECANCRARQPRACIDFAARNLMGCRIDGSSPFTGGDQLVAGHFFGQSSFATHAVCRASRAIKVAKGSPLEVLACLGSEFLLGAGVVLDAFELKEGDSLVVVGAGTIGLAATMIAKVRGAKTIVVAEADERRRMLASELGADAAVHTDESLADLVRSLDADGAKFALETTGAARARHACLASVADDATCAFIGGIVKPTFDAQEMSRQTLRIVSLDSHAPPAVLVPKLAALHVSGDLPLEKLVDFFPFEHVNDALQALRSGTVAKPVLRFSIGGFAELDRAQVEGARQDAPESETHPESTRPTKPELVKS